MFFFIIFVAFSLLSTSVSLKCRCNQEFVDYVGSHESKILTQYIIGRSHPMESPEMIMSYVNGLYALLKQSCNVLTGTCDISELKCDPTNEICQRMQKDKPYCVAEDNYYFRFSRHPGSFSRRQVDNTLYIFTPPTPRPRRYMHPISRPDQAPELRDWIKDRTWGPREHNLIKGCFFGGNYSKPWCLVLPKISKTMNCQTNMCNDKWDVLPPDRYCIDFDQFKDSDEAHRRIVTNSARYTLAPIISKQHSPSEVPPKPKWESNDEPEKMNTVSDNSVNTVNATGQAVQVQPAASVAILSLSAIRILYITN